MDYIYFDHNATSNVRQDIISYASDLFQKYQYLNPSANHKFGKKSYQLLCDAKDRIKSSIISEESQNDYDILFTSNASEANNMVVNSFKNDNILISAIEHASIYESTKYYYSNYSSGTSIIKVDLGGEVDYDDLDNKINNLDKKKKILLSIVHSNNETGIIQDFNKIHNITKNHNNIILHSDMTQSLGKIKLNIDKLNIDLATISMHKIGGLHNIAALIYKKNITLTKMIYGGRQQNNLRAGTEDVFSILIFAKLCSILNNEIEKYNQISLIRDYLEKELKNIAGNDIIFFSQNKNRTANVSNFATKNLDNQTQFIFFDMNNIFISIGSACNQGNNRSKILSNMGFDANIVNCAIRISLSKDNNINEINFFLQKYRELYNNNLT